MYVCMYVCMYVYIYMCVCVRVIHILQAVKYVCYCILGYYHIPSKLGGCEFSYSPHPPYQCMVKVTVIRANGFSDHSGD